MKIDVKKSTGAHIFEWIREINLEMKPFIFYGTFYSLLLLIVPSAVQFLVNELSFSNLKVSIFTLLFFIFLVLLVAQFVFYAKYNLIEYLERKIQGELILLFEQSNKLTGKQKHLYFELPLINKTFSQWAGHGLDIFLTVFFGFLLLVLYHPMFVILLVAVIAVLWVIMRIGSTAVTTAYELSNVKYILYSAIESNQLTPTMHHDWLNARHNHFKTLRNQMRAIMFLQVILQIGTLIIGSMLIIRNELSLGQFVSAEIIASGIFYSFTKLSKFLEMHYGLIVSFLKVDIVRGTWHE